MDALSTMSKRAIALGIAGIVILAALVALLFGHHGSSHRASATSRATPRATGSGGAWSNAPSASSTSPSNSSSGASSSSSPATTEGGEIGPHDPSDEVTQPTDSHSRYAVPSSQTFAAAYPTSSQVYQASSAVASSTSVFSSNETSADAAARVTAMKNSMTPALWALSNPTTSNSSPWDAAKAQSQVASQKISSRIEGLTVRDVGSDMPNTSTTRYLHVWYNVVTYANGNETGSTQVKKSYIMKNIGGVWKVDQIMDDVN